MAKKEKSEEKEKSGEYNINDLASEMGVEPATARIALRKKGVKKSGRSYSWGSRSEIRDLAKKLKTSSKPAKEENDEDDVEVKAAKKSSRKKAA